MKIRTQSPEETKRLGYMLGQYLKPGDVVLLLANLGSGKTTFVQGLVKRFGVKEEALSPTFVIAQTLRGKIPVHHLDFYRLNKTEIFDFGIQDYLTGTGEIAPGVVLIEWAERCKEVWPAARLEIDIRIRPQSQEREFTFRGKGKRFTSLLTKLKGNS